MAAQTSAVSLRTNFRRKMRKLAEDTAAAALQSHRVRQYAFNALHLLTDSASVTVNGIHYVFPTSDWIIGRSLYIDGRWDDEFMQATVNVLTERRPSPSFAEGIFVDVGANIGTTTIQALARYGARHAVAVEPSPECLPYLYSNLAANRLSGRCDIVEAAVSDVSGEVAFRAGKDNSGAGEVMWDGDPHDYAVRSQTLDDIIPSLGIGLDELSLVWIDAEGQEYRILNGAKNIIAAGTPMVIEFWPQRLRENGDYSRLIETLALSFGTIIDIRAYVQGTRGSIVESSAEAIDAQAKALGPWPTDLLLLPNQP